MIRKVVVSSNIHSVGYEDETKTLEIEFHSGRVYQYYSVPRVIYEALMNASSHGKYFHAFIRDVFSYQRIR